MFSPPALSPPGARGGSRAVPFGRAGGRRPAEKGRSEEKGNQRHSQLRAGRRVCGRSAPLGRTGLFRPGHCSARPAPGCGGASAPRRAPGPSGTGRGRVCVSVCASVCVFSTADSTGTRAGTGECEVSVCVCLCPCLCVSVCVSVCVCVCSAPRPREPSRCPRGGSGGGRAAAPCGSASPAPGLPPWTRDWEAIPDWQAAVLPHSSTGPRARAVVVVQLRVRRGRNKI